MKVFAVACCLFAVAQASLVPAPITAKLLSTGTSSSSRTQDSNGNYAFAYNEQHNTGGSSRQESGNAWSGVTGTYTLNVADGRQRTVKYVADGAGFRAAIATNEPGTAALPAADTSISSPYAPPQPVQPLPVPVAVAPVAVAPVAIAPAIHAPAPLPALALSNGWNSAPVALAPALPVAVKVAPAVSSYSTSINHVAPAAPIAVAAPLPLPALPAPIIAKGWNSGWN